MVKTKLVYKNIFISSLKIVKNFPAKLLTLYKNQKLIRFALSKVPGGYISIALIEINS